MCRALVLGLAAAPALTVASCGGSETKGDSETANSPGSRATRADSRLREAPTPLRRADLRTQRPGTARAAVLNLLYFAQWGSAPNIAAAYDPAIRAAIGVSNIVGTYSQQRAALLTSRPRILESRETRTGSFVAVELLRADASPARHSFSLRRRLGRWRIVHDTLLEGGLENYAASSQSRNPVGQPPDARAASRARELVRTYRGMFASIPDR